MNRWNASWDLFWNDLDFSKLLEFEGHCSRRRRLVAKKLIDIFCPSCPFVD